MKKLLLFMLLVMTMPVTMMAGEQVTIDGIKYDLVAKGKTATVIAGDEKYHMHVVIPATVIYNNVTYNVVGIGGDAFQGCNSLKSVTIPNSVTSIGNNAFSGCATWNFTSVHISDIVAWCNISFGSEASNPLLYAKHLYLNGEEIKDLVIPEGVTSIGNYAFYCCSGLTSITIPNSVTSIGNSAFYNCSGLTSVTIPESVTSIGNGAFSSCSSLTSVTIPSSVTSIGGYVFRGCTGLTSVTIPSSVTSIGGEAFYGCSGLTSIDIPESVTSIGSSAFSACSGLTSIIVASGNTKYDSRNNCKAIIEKASNQLIVGCKNTVIPNSVTSIGGGAFSRCSGLTSVDIPSSVTSIGNGAFSSCSSLTSVDIPSSVTSIGDRAFSSCSSLTSVTIPSSVTSIGSYAFYCCTGLTSITIPNSVTSIGDNTFYQCSGLTSVTIPESVTSIGSSAFNGCSGLTSVTIPSSVTSIGNYAFSYCIYLTYVTSNATSVPSTGTNVFNGSDVEYATLIVPDEAYDAYSTKAPWSNFGTKLKLSEATVVSANSYTREYGDANPTFEYSSAVTLNGTPTITCTADATSAPGTYPITISQGTVTNTGLVFVDGTLTITKAPLTVTAQSYTITEGDDLPTFEVEYTGLKNGETEEVLNPVINCTATNSNTPGVYPITVTVTTDNYEVTNEAGTLTIVPTEAVINISSAGMATYCSPYDLDFSGVKNLKAYIISGYDWANKKVFATRVYDVPAGTGLYLVAPEGEYHVNIGSTSCYYINMLVGTTSSITLEPTDGDVTNLILTGTSPQNASFKTLAASRTFGANKAYLQIPTSVLSSSANAVGIIFDDETDGIESISGMGHANGDWFTLDGRKLNSRPAQKGVYILNGNKIVIK